MPRRPPFRFPRFGYLAAALLVGDILSNMGPRRIEPPQALQPGIPPAVYDWTGWTVVCGPVAFNPSYPNSYRYDWAAGTCTGAPICTLGGQAVSFTAQTPTSRCAKLWQGPNSVNRYYGIEQRSRPVGAPPIIAISMPSVIPGLVQGVAAGQPVTRPGLVSVGVQPVPVRLLPIVARFPWYAEQADRGWRPPYGGMAPIGVAIRDMIADLPKGGSRGERPPRVIPLPGYVDVKPAMPDKELKLADASGRMAALFKTLSVYGSANGVIDALWRSLPAYARTRSARTDQKYADVLAAFARGDLNADAYGQAVAYWLNYKAAGALFGQAFRAAEGIGAGGYQLYRAWATGEYVGQGVGNFSFDVAVGGYRATPSGNTRRNTPHQVGYQRGAHIASRYEAQRRAIERAFTLQHFSDRRRSRRLAVVTRNRRLRELNSWRRNALAGTGGWQGPGWRT